MKTTTANPAGDPDARVFTATESEPPRALTAELLILPDGKILVHNLTPAMARLLHTLNPDDPQIAPRHRKARNTQHATRR